jgi:hypothetical protein
MAGRIVHESSDMVWQIQVRGRHLRNPRKAFERHAQGTNREFTKCIVSISDGIEGLVREGHQETTPKASKDNANKESPTHCFLYTFLVSLGTFSGNFNCSDCVFGHGLLNRREHSERLNVHTIICIDCVTYGLVERR